MIKEYVVKTKYDPENAYPLELRPTGKWLIQHFPEDDHSVLFIEHRCGCQGEVEWIRENDIELIEIFEN
jgi:hypothetical protein